MSELKEIDTLVKQMREKRTELEALGEKIEASSVQIAILFVDLNNSTDLKNAVNPIEWLGYIYEFLRSVTEKTILSGGTVVKRIGDELMLTFNTVVQSETLIDALISDPLLQRYQYKIAADYGSAYNFRFDKHLELDPYGQIIDRCARIVKMANAGAILVSESYFIELPDTSSKYVMLGSFSMKGIREPQQIYFRPLSSEAPEEYIEPLLSSLNNSDIEYQGYRTVSRKFPPHYFRELLKGTARPFLLRELLNIPRLPLTPQQFKEKMEVPNAIESQYYGYLVEWSGEFISYKKSSDKIMVTVTINKNGMYDKASLCLVPDMLEIVQSLTPGVKICFCGIITEVFIHIRLNYVEILSIEEEP